MNEINQLEKKLKALQTKSPSPHLRDRIFPLPERTPWWSRSVQLGWSFAFACAMGIIGFAAGTMQDQFIITSTQPVGTYEIQIVEQNQTNAIFDISTSENDFLSGNVIATEEVIEEI